MIKKSLCVLLTALVAVFTRVAKTETDLFPLEVLREMDLEALMKIDVVVTSAAKKPQRLSETAAAVFVITPEDIRRSGVTSIAEALRMAPGVQVARIDANKWAISVRGLNGRFSNKLLVLIDGRSVYTPVFSGVFWDKQDTLLEDIARIEVIRGPGATLWGANAVNGVINIITKRAQETQGGLVAASAGTEERGAGGVRYGGQLGEEIYYRVYAKYFNVGDAGSSSRGEAADAWDVARGGFRLDWEVAGRDALTVQGDVFDGKAGVTNVLASLSPPFVETTRPDVAISGGNLLGRWKHSVSVTSDLGLQVYYDRAKRDDPELFKQIRETLDIELQQHFRFRQRQEITWGLNYRSNDNDTVGSFTLSFDPSSGSDELFSGFVQDDIALVEEQARLTLGSKFEHNDFTGFEIQPNVRLLWTPDEGHAVWAAVSRAVRTPSRSELDARLNQEVLPGEPPKLVSLFGQSDFDAEKLLAFELGYRVQPSDRLFMDFAAFYNLWDSLRTVEPAAPFPEASPLPPHLVIPFFAANKMEGETYGVELAVDWQLADRWRLQSAYSYLQIALSLDKDSGDMISEAAEGESPDHQFSIRSSVDLLRSVDFDLWLRYADSLSSLGVDSYLAVDARFAWRPTRNLELSLVGQNFLDAKHPEFVPELVDVLPTQVERGVYGKILWLY